MVYENLKLTLTCFFGIKVSALHFSRKRQDGSALNFFQGLGANILFIPPALKNTAFGL